MARNDIRGTATSTMVISRFLGQNTAVSFAEIKIEQSPEMLNMLPGKIGSLMRRPGSVPLTSIALDAAIKVLCNLRSGSSNDILSTSGTTLYKYNGTDTTWDAQTMTDALETDDIGFVQFKDASGNVVLVITDGGDLKQYDGTTVKIIPPAANDADPLPPNAMTTIMASNPPTGCTIHNNRVVIWDGSDTIFHSKPGFFDYFIATDFQRFVKENDTVVTCITFHGALLVLMRRHLAALFGDGYSATPTAGDWSQDFLDTDEGCINGDTVQLVTFPDGSQQIFYLSDKGVNAVTRIDTISLDTSARYATRSMTNDKLDWDALGVSKSDWEQAKASFWNGLYWLAYPKGDEWNGLIFNTQDGEWYPFDNLDIASFYHDDNNLYFAGADGHLKQIDDTLYADYGDAAKTTSDTINAYWYSKMINPKLTGYNHFWDTMMIEARQYKQASSIDLEVNTYSGQFIKTGAVKNAFMIIGSTKIGEGVIANENFTDFVNLPELIRTFLVGQYAQIKISNNRAEPFEIFSITYNVRVME